MTPHLSHRLTNRAPSKLAVPDPFARDLSRFDVMNISRVRVAGGGGFGLVLVALAVVLQYDLLKAAYAIAIAGGVCCGVALILYRRRHHAASVSQYFEHL